jgi:hypothetical protein
LYQPLVTRPPAGFLATRATHLLHARSAPNGQVFTIVAFTVDASTAAWVARYARAIAASLLALVAFGSLVFTPFTEQYARESVPREFWSSPRFQHVNRQLTLMWGLVFTAMIPSHVIAGAIDTRRANTIFNWVVPVILIVWAANRTGQLSASGGEKRPE